MGKLGVIVLSTFWTTLIFSAKSVTCELKDVVSWTQLDFEYPNDAIRQEQIKSNFKESIQAGLVVFDLDVWNDKLFLSIPRVGPNVPATLSYVNLNEKTANATPKLVPYPDWQTNQVNTTGSRIISITKFDIDACDRLWLMDNGVEDIFSGRPPVRPPRIHIYDLKTDKLIREYEIKARPVNAPSSIIVDVTKDKCDKAFAYAFSGAGLVVYDFKNNESWTCERQNSKFDPFGAALSAPDSQGIRTLYFRTPNDGQEFAVSTKVLQNKTAANDGTHFRYVGKKSGIGGFTFDEKSGVLFYTNLRKEFVSCWNSIKHPANATDIMKIQPRGEKTVLTVAAGAKVDENGNLWLAQNFQYQFGSAQPNDSTKPRLVISKTPVAELIKGTPCDAA